MSGLTLDLAIDGIPGVLGQLSGLTDLERSDLAFNIGALLESSTKRRIADEKSAPDGTPWVPWSEAYDDTREEHHSLLVGEGNLLDSVQNYSAGAEARVGTNLVYGAIHHFGGEEVGSNIPARPYLGLSANDRAEIMALVTGEIEERVQ